MCRKHFATISAIAVFSFSAPAGALDHVGGCMGSFALGSGLGEPSALPRGGCPKVMIFSVSGDIGTACVLYLSDDDRKTIDTSWPPDALPDGRSARMTVPALLAY